MARRRITLADLAHARSGDKGNHANVAVFAYTPAGFAWLREHLTAERVLGFLRPSVPAGAPHSPRAERYEAANVLAFNFVLYDVLQGGASQSLHTDSQGKALALALLQMPLDRPNNYPAMRRPARRKKS